MFGLQGVLDVRDDLSMSVVESDLGQYYAVKLEALLPRTAVGCYMGRKRPDFVTLAGTDTLITVSSQVQADLHKTLPEMSDAIKNFSDGLVTFKETGSSMFLGR